jgi:hypothetical protein
MTLEKSSFFNSVAGDRKYQASSFAEYFNSLLTNGVFPNPSNNLQILSNNNSTITVKTGKAWINGYMYFNDGDLTIPINVADGILNRIDRVAIRMDTVGRAINAVVIVGTPATNPIAPALQRDVDGYELGVADIYVGKGVTSIVQANITDTRMSTILCGWVNSLIQADTTALFNQYKDWYTTKQNSYNGDFTTWTTAKKLAYDTWYADITTTEQNQIDALESRFQNDWDVWFTSIKNALAGDVAGNLMTKINTIPMVFGGSVAPVSPTSIDFWFKEI